MMLPEGAPERLNDRETLWNEVEAGEKRKDAQLAREVEFSIPREMTQEQGVALARDFVKRNLSIAAWSRTSMCIGIMPRMAVPSRTRMSCCRCAR
jgi:hypothetical protein